MKLNIEKLNIFIFAVYNFAYLLRMSGYLPRNLYLYVLGAFILVLLIEITKGLVYQRSFYYARETIEVLSVAVLFFFISLFTQLVHNNFDFYLITELLYFIIPMLVAFVALNYGGTRQIISFLYIILIRSVLYFILENRGNFSIFALTHISFFDTHSSAFEMVIAHDFLFLAVIFTYLKRYSVATASTLLCILCFKRLPFLLSFPLLIVILYYWIASRFSVRSTRRLNAYLREPVSKNVIPILFLLILVLPYLMIWLYSSDGSYWISDTLSIQINKFTTGRALSIRNALAQCEFNGLGSSRAYYESIGKSVMHCDVIRLYKEVFIVGYATFCGVLLHLMSRHRVLFFLLCYLLLEMVLSHIVDSLNLWIILYLFSTHLYLEKIDFITCEQN